MELNLSTYRDKVMGCWAGKNVGGVLGAPFEGIRQVVDIDFYVQDLSKGAPANDDLDLQIAWLAAVERYGRQVNASILGDYWLSYIIPNWVEYGTGKANLRAGLVPPMAGYVDNTYKDSCGCFIRSEIWACLAPGHPEIAAKYAYEDAIVDHAGEGMLGEIFFAAVESAAFVESDPRKLIDIGLSYIPQESKVAGCIRLAVECYDQGVSMQEARKRIHNYAPGTFGVQSAKVSDVDTSELELGAPGFDAPENIGFTIAGWMYGEGDFGKSLCLAVSCGEDTDCTSATLGAVMGIISGASGLPEKWTKPLNDQIVTMCIDKTSAGIWVPQTATQLAERILRVTPGFLGADLCDAANENGYVIHCDEGDALYCCKADDYLPMMNGNGKDNALSVSQLSGLSPFVIRADFPAFWSMLDLGNDCYFTHGKTRKLKVTVYNDKSMREQQWVRITLYTPQGVEVVGARSYLLPLNNLWQYKAEAVFEVDADYFTGSKLELLVDISLEGRHSTGAMKAVLMRRPCAAGTGCACGD